MGLGRMWPLAMTGLHVEGDAGVTPAPQLHSLRMQAEPDSVPLGANLSLTLAAFSAGFSKDQGVLGWVTAELAPRYKTPF